MTTLNESSAIDNSVVISSTFVGVGATSVDWDFWLAEATDVEVGDVQENDEGTEEVLPDWVFEIPPVEELIELLGNQDETLAGMSDAGTYATPAPSTPASSWTGLDDGQHTCIDSETTGEILYASSEQPDFVPNSPILHATLPTIDSFAPPSSVEIPNDASVPLASSSRGRWRRVLLAPREDDGAEPSLLKDASGYAVPLAIYSRLANEDSKVKTEVLDRILAPMIDESLKDFDAETITCQFRQKIVNGLWTAGNNTPCGTTLRSWDSYRRHLLRSHLAIPRTDNILEEAQKRKDEIQALTVSSVQSSPSSSAPSRRNHGREAGRLGVKRRREAEAEIEDSAETIIPCGPLQRRRGKQERNRERRKRPG